MVEKISEILKDLAKKHEITIIYAVESGSRAWGFESDDSDYGKKYINKKNNNKKIFPNNF